MRASAPPICTRIVELGKTILQYPVELLPDVRDAVLAIAAEHPVVLITKGDLVHREQKKAPLPMGVANGGKTMKHKDYNVRRHRSGRCPCGRARPDMLRSCPGFGKIMGAA